MLQNIWLCKSDYILTFRPFQICDMHLDIRTPWRCSLVWICALRSFGSNSCQFDDHCLRRCHFNLVFCIFGICHMLTDIQTTGWCYFWFSMSSLSLMRTWISVITLGHVSLLFLRATFSGLLMFSLTFRYCEGASCFWSIFCCRTEIWARIDARCWSVSKASTVCTMIRLL